MSVDPSPRSICDFKKQYAIQLRDFIVVLWIHGCSYIGNETLLHECSSACNMDFRFNDTNTKTGEYKQQKAKKKCPIIQELINEGKRTIETGELTCICQHCCIVEGYLDNKDIAYVLEPFISNF